MPKKQRRLQARRLRWPQVSIDIIGLSCGRRLSNETCLIWVPLLSQVYGPLCTICTFLTISLSSIDYIT
jgi:hypothetical protein